jgi:hypothetical protein
MLLYPNIVRVWNQNMSALMLKLMRLKLLQRELLNP